MCTPNGVKIFEEITMTKFQSKCKTYDEEVEKNRKLIKYNKLIAILPAAVFGLLGIVLAILTGVQKSVDMPYLFLIFTVVGVIYYFVMYVVLNSKFVGNNTTIVTKYWQYYKPSENRMAATIDKDNKNICLAINKNGKNPLIVYLQNDEMCFLSNGIIKLKELSLRTSGVGKNFEDILNMDFGKLIIPVEDIDSYRDNQMMVNFNDSVLKIDFSKHDFMDFYIPKKDFYFNVDKKNMAQ